MTRRTPRRRLVVALLAAAAAIVGVLAPATFSPTTSADALSGSQFQDGYIISDQSFFDWGSMDAGAVQSFLESQVPTCYASSGQPCLRNYSTSVTAIGGDSFCSGMSGGTMSGAQIIVAAARACRISPKVLLVMLQKEQGLITSTSPSSWSYQAALGQSCPDTAPCDSAYSGFYRQVYYGARQMRMYIDRPEWYSYQLGWNNILYNPNTGCGSKSVYIKNDATRALYIYTPYTPNQAALNNLYGTGDGCSAYGNRNFWRLYSDWFGSPTEASPIGVIDSAGAASGGIRVAGWALDFDTTDSLTIHVYVDGAFASGFGANIARSDIDTAFGRGANYGFDTVVPVSGGGTHQVCIYALNVGSGSNTQLGCRQVSMFGSNPFGVVDNIVPQPGGLGIWGWAIDADTSDPIWMHVYVDGSFAGAYRADQSRTDVQAAIPGFGANHGYSFNITAAPGPHRVCVYAINVGAGSYNPQLACRDTQVGGNPVGPTPAATTGPQQITVNGWAVDPDTTDPVWVHVYVDGRFATATYASGASTDMNVYHAFGANHGYSATFTASSGDHQVCVYGINTGYGGNSQIGCTTVTVGASPVGAIADGQPDYGSIGVWGWAYDPDVVDTSLVHIYMDGAFAWGGGASQSSAGAGIPAAYGTNHGYAARFYAAPGTHQVCVYALNIGTGSNTQVGCFTTTVAAANPLGVVDTATAEGAGIRLTGWAIDPDTTGPLTLHVYVDGNMSGGFATSLVRSDVTAIFPGYSVPGYSGLVSATSGTHTVCVYALNTGSGSVNSQLGCRSVTVP